MSRARAGTTRRRRGADPLGGITFYRDGSHGSTLADPTIVKIAAAHGGTPAQVMLRWHLQQGRQAIPKSVTPSRIDVASTWR